MRHLTFKEYLESKERLSEAVENTPKQTTTYDVTKYCRLVVGESKDDKTTISLKPKNRIIVEWEYLSIDNPTPLSIKFDGAKDVDPFNDHTTFWQGKKLQTWLWRNTREENNA